MQQQDQDEEARRKKEHRGRIRDPERLRELSERPAPRREDERHDAGQEPQQRVPLLQPAATNQLEDHEQEQDGGDRSRDRNANRRRRHFSSRGVGERRKRPTKSASVTLIM